jgi:ankyrin repeat protein
MRVLIEAGADPSVPGTNGRTPLHEAVSRGDEAMVRLLLDAGADPGREDRWGGTPAEVARDLAARGGADLTALVGPVR